MCIGFLSTYWSCPHEGEYYLFPCCPDPDICESRKNRAYVIHKISDIPNGIPQLPDFCPQCLKNSDSFESVLDEEARAALTENPAYPHLDASHRYVAETLWKRVETQSLKSLDEEDYDTYNPIGPSDLTAIVFKEVQQHLAYSFWQEVVIEKGSPGLIKRAFLIHMRKQAELNFVQSKAREHFVQEATKAVRPGRARELFEPVDLRSIGDDRDCFICKDALGEQHGEMLPEYPIRTPCGHVYGEHCIGTWLTDHEDCPLCRTNILTFAATESTTPEQKYDLREENSVTPRWLRYILGIDPANVEEDLETILDDGVEAFLRKSTMGTLEQLLAGAEMSLEEMEIMLTEIEKEAEISRG